MSALSSKQGDALMEKALGGRGFGRGGEGGKPVPAPPPLAVLREGEIEIGIAENGDPIGLDLARLMDGRLLIQGTSGAGKSWTLRRIIEQTHGLVQQVILDPEGEYRELAQELDLFHLEGHRLDAASIAVAAERARHHRVSIVLDLSELDREEQMKMATAFLNAFVAAPREHWHPVIVAVDEAHLFAPWGGHTEATSVRKASIAALTDMMSRGRKRGICGILATQRIARIAKSVVSEAQNVMVGMNTLDIDIRRASETIGWDASKGFDRLPLLSPGDFVSVGSAFTRYPAILRVGPVRTAHRGASPELSKPMLMDSAASAKLIDVDALFARSEDDRAIREENQLPAGYRHIRGFIRDAAFPVAGMVWSALSEIAPEGARVADLGASLGVKQSEAVAALALLDQYGTIEFQGAGKNRVVRIMRGMLA